MINRIISFGSKTIIETLQEEKSRYSSHYTANDIDLYINSINKNQKLAQTKITKKIGEGSSAIAYETEDGDILKLTRERHYPLLRPHEDFDVPIKKQGKSGKIYYYFEEKLYQHNLNEGFTQQVIDMIKDKGYRVYDFDKYDTHQIGISKDGKLYLLDPECARFKTIFHALWSKLKKVIHKQNI